MNSIAAIFILFFTVIPGLTEDAGWLTLFDGSHTAHWLTRDGDDFPGRGWSVDRERGLLICDGGGDIMTRRQYQDFELRFEFRINRGGNSGIFYRYQGDRQEAPEYQILDDERHPDGQRGRAGTRKTAALYDVFAADAPPLKPAGNWNSGRIIAVGSKIEHWLNGALVLSYDTDSPEFGRAVSGSKFAGKPQYGQNSCGHIVLQDHRDVVAFRNIRIRTLR